MQPCFTGVFIYSIYQSPVKDAPAAPGHGQSGHVFVLEPHAQRPGGRRPAPSIRREGSDAALLDKKSQGVI